jgi:DNA-directed RNA polymerase I, II, and III subunit RPABC1
MDNKDKIMLFKVRQNILEMLEDRNYSIPDDMKSIHIDEFNAMCNNDAQSFLIKGNSNNDIYVYIHIKQKLFGKKDLKEVVEEAKETYNENINVLLILDKYNQSAIDKELHIYKNVEFFQRKQMVFNITKNYLVPKHILLTEEEKQEVFKIYKTDSINIFPIISKNDPLARYYNMQVGNLCKIIRSCPTSGISIAYRGVV